MRLNISKAKKALFEADLSYADFATRYGIHRSYLYNAFDGVAMPGRKFFGAWAKFCKDYNLDFLDFFIFED